ncbi:cadherin-7-like [Mustelus asterias]
MSNITRSREIFVQKAVVCIRELQAETPGSTNALSPVITDVDVTDCFSSIASDTAPLLRGTSNSEQRGFQVNRHKLPTPRSCQLFEKAGLSASQTVTEMLLDARHPLTVSRTSTEKERLEVDIVTGSFFGRTGRVSWALKDCADTATAGHDKELKAATSGYLEYPTLKCRPYYLPREITSVILMVVYIPPHAGVKITLDKIFPITNSLETKHPEASFIMAGDFKPFSTLSVFSRLVPENSSPLGKFSPLTQSARRSSPLPGMLSCHEWWAVLMGCAMLEYHITTSVHAGRKQAGNQPPSHPHVRQKLLWNQLFVLEEYLGTEPLHIGKLQLHSDSNYGNGSLRYNLTGDGAGSLFTIDEDKGDIYLIKRLDREVKPFYILQAQVVDRATNQHVEPESEFMIKVQDINDNEPQFLDGPYVATVPEMSPDGTFVTQVTATDADDPSYGSHARILYHILQGQPYFLVEPTTGIIRVALPNMDREAKEHHMVIIEAKDMAGLKGGLSATTTVTITLSDVNDNRPKFQHKLYHFSVPESSSIDTTVGRIMATDVDIGPNAEMNYTVEAGDGSDSFGMFTDRETQEGVIMLKKRLDYEHKRRLSIRVEAINKYIDRRLLHLGPFKDVTNVKINVLDVDEPPLFTSPEYVFKIRENGEAGAFVGKVTARDPDAVDNSIRYFIDRHTEVDRIFNIDAKNGTITTSRSLDREAVPWYNLTVSASEASDPKKVTSIQVHIRVLDDNDHAPVFPIPYETFVCENAKHGQLVQTISAVDQDEPLEGHRFHFALASDAVGNLNFTVRDNQDNTAAILTQRAGFSRGEQATHFLPILIMDNGTPSLSSTCTLTIRVCRCNSNGIGQLCNADAFFLPAGLSTGALIAILVCILMILALVLLLLALRRHRKDPHFANEGDDVRENMVRFNDEGGGEEDTHAFSMATLRNSRVGRRPKARKDVKSEIPSLYRQSLQTMPDAAVFREFVKERLHEADTDPSAPPFDSLQTYAYEGTGSVAGSLSSSSSLASSSDECYDYLSDWGPRFRKLADLYGNSGNRPAT